MNPGENPKILTIKPDIGRQKTGNEDQMEKRIELERRGKTPGQTTNLILDNCRATQIEGLTEEYVLLESLSMINVGLTSLKGFPKLVALQRLELSDNRISGNLNVLEGCPLMTHLNLSGNKIKDLDVLEPLKNLDKLTHLDIFGNPLESSEGDEFRNKVFKMLPNLKYLDGADVNNEECPDSDAEEANGNGNAEDEEDESGEDEEDEEDGDDEEGEEEEDEDDEDEEGPGLSALYNDKLGEAADEDDGDYDENAAGEEEDEDIDEEEDEAEASGEPTSAKRRKTDGEENGGGGD